MNGKKKSLIVGVCFLLVVIIALAAAIFTEGFTNLPRKGAGTSNTNTDTGTGAGNSNTDDKNNNTDGDGSKSEGNENSDNSNNNGNETNTNPGNQDEVKYTIYLDSLGSAGLEIVKLEGLPRSAAKGEPIEFTAEVCLDDSEEYYYENYYVSGINMRENATGEDLGYLDQGNDGKYFFIMPGVDIELMFYIIPTE